MVKYRITHDGCSWANFPYRVEDSIGNRLIGTDYSVTYWGARYQLWRYKRNLVGVQKGPRVVYEE